MHVIARAALVTFWTKHPDAERPLRAWFQITRTARWSHFAELKATFRSADQVGQFVVFDIGGNRFRLIAYVDYEYKKVFVRRVLTHAAYDRGDWENDPWF